jgi:hypothetical protein
MNCPSRILAASSRLPSALGLGDGVARRRVGLAQGADAVPQSAVSSPAAISGSICFISSVERLLVTAESSLK